MHEQKSVKPKIEDALANVMQGDELDNGLKRIAYLRETAWSWNHAVFQSLINKIN